MPRPAILIAEPEPAEALSLRKLVMETGRFNVLTAHSSNEALDIEQQSPAIAGTVFVAGLPGIEQAIKHVKSHRPGLPVILLSPNQTERFDGVDHSVSSHEPEALLSLCRQLFGDPRDVKY